MDTLRTATFTLSLADADADLLESVAAHGGCTRGLRIDARLSP